MSWGDIVLLCIMPLNLGVAYVTESRFACALNLAAAGLMLVAILT